MMPILYGADAVAMDAEQTRETKHLTSSKKNLLFIGNERVLISILCFLN